jgi:hypothetical protein
LNRETFNVLHLNLVLKRSSLSLLSSIGLQGLMIMSGNQETETRIDIVTVSPVLEVETQRAERINVHRIINIPDVLCGVRNS